MPELPCHLIQRSLALLFVALGPCFVQRAPRLPPAGVFPTCPSFPSPPASGGWQNQSAKPSEPARVCPARGAPAVTQVGQEPGTSIPIPDHPRFHHWILCCEAHSLGKQRCSRRWAPASFLQATPGESGDLRLWGQKGVMQHLQVRATLRPEKGDASPGNLARTQHGT